MRSYERGQVWYIDYSFNGRRYRKAVGTSKRMAELALKNIEVKIAKGEFLGVQEEKRMTFDELGTEYLRFSKANKRPQVYRRDRVMINNLLKVFSGKEINDISVHDLEQYKMQRKNAVTVSTVNRELTCIKHMYNKAVEWEFTRYNQLKSVKRFKEPPGRLRYLSEDEIEQLVQQCTDHLKPIVVMALNTGMRKSEILNLSWNNVDMESKVITIRRSKNNETRIVPINDTLYEMLETLKNDNNGQVVFVNKNGKSLTDIRHSFRNALKKAGIEDFRFHDLRHTFASQLVMAGVDIRTVQELMGHKDIRMTMRYSHLSDAHLKEAVNHLKYGTNMAQAEIEKNQSLAKY